jgi:peptidyl-tRNA hydrolase
VNVIESCVPNIKNAWAVPAMDVDTLLIGIRIASYGHDMEFGTSCPKCQMPSDRTLDLRTALDSIRTPDYNASIDQGDMKIFLKPMSYQNLNDNNRLQYENQKMLQNLPELEIEDDKKMSALSSALKKITDITVRAIALSVAAIKTPTALVTEPEYIEEWLHNCDKKIFTQVRDSIVALKSQSEMQPLKITCDSCSHEYEQTVTLDMTSFFGAAS